MSVQRVEINFLHIHISQRTRRLQKRFLCGLCLKGEHGCYFGWIEEVPEAMSQGTSVNEHLENLKGALSLVLEDKKSESMKIITGQKVTRRKIVC